MKICISEFKISKMTFKRWLRKWLMFCVAFFIGNKIYGSKFDDRVSWRLNGYSAQLSVYNDLTTDFMTGKKSK